MSRNGSAILDGLTSLQGSQLALPIAATAGILIVSGVVLPLFRTKKENEIEELGGWSIMTAWPFFEKRYDFIKSNFLKTGKNMFTFKVLQHSVTAIQGEDARVAFFDNRSLSFLEGYRILMGAVPRLQDIDVAPEMNEDVSWFNKMILKLLNRDRLNEVLPSLLDDVQARTLTWGEEGTMDPFKNIYDLVYQMTVRMATCQELASDIDAVTKLQGYFWTCEKAATPTALLLPWFPGSAKKSKEEATKALYAMLWQYVEDRRNAEVPSSDAIDLCIRKEGLDNATTIAFIIGVVFAGVVNTGINSCWVILFLAHHPQWKEAVIKEVQALIKSHTNTTSNEPLHKQLGQIPVSVWEEEMPVMETIIRETIRIVVGGTALRRNISGDLDIAGKNLPEGNFLAYSLTNSHLNEAYYTNPTEFDPTRFGPGREEDKNGPYAFVGWGAGRHPCTGMKVAKLEIKVIVAMFVAAYEFSVVDKNGKPPAKLPKPDYNDIQQARPVGDPCFIKFKRVHE